MVAVDPEGTLAESADVEEGVSGGGEGEVAAAEGWALHHIVVGEGGGQGLHGERVDLPLGEGGAVEGDCFGDALGFAAHALGEVGAGGVFYEDIEAGRAGGLDGESGELTFFEVAAVEGSG